MSSGRYILDGHTPVPVEDLLEWARWIETNERHVADDYPAEGLMVSTVFLGVDHNFWHTGPALLFETMIFGGPHDQWQRRCSTWDQAVKMHAAALDLVTCPVEQAPDTL